MNTLKLKRVLVNLVWLCQKVYHSFFLTIAILVSIVLEILLFTRETRSFFIYIIFQKLKFWVRHLNEMLSVAGNYECYVCTSPTSDTGHDDHCTTFNAAKPPPHETCTIDGPCMVSHNQISWWHLPYVCNSKMETWRHHILGQYCKLKMSYDYLLFGLTTVTKKVPGNAIVWIKVFYDWFRRICNLHCNFVM